MYTFHSILSARLLSKISVLFFFAKTRDLHAKVTLWSRKLILSPTTKTRPQNVRGYLATVLWFGSRIFLSNIAQLGTSMDLSGGFGKEAFGIAATLKRYKELWKIFVILVIESLLNLTFRSYALFLFSAWASGHFGWRKTGMFWLRAVHPSRVMYVYQFNLFNGDTLS